MILSSKLKSLKNYEFINVLRGAAALLVALLHFFINTQSYYGQSDWSKNLEPFFLGIFDIGKFSIGLFFLVSGFLIPFSLERSKSIYTFTIHRIFRLYPAYWFSISVFLGLNSWFAYESKASLGTILANLTMLQGYLRHPDLIGAFWTLQIELTFYILCVVLFCCGVSNKPIRIAYCCLLVTITGSLFSYLGFRVPTALFIALTLMYCADSLRRNTMDDKTKILWIITALSLGVISKLAYGDIFIRYALSYWAAMLVFYLAYSYQYLPWFRSLFFVFMADISYSVYLLHDPIGIQLLKYLASKNISASVSYTAAFSATIFASTIVFVFIEKPFIRMGKKLSEKFMTLDRSS
jgi:peptidoglycan/LPS O-acetylase OafA/YrhL